MMRIGQGWDIHRLVPGEALILGGVSLPSPWTEKGHSDGDALLHAIIDALLGACALGDIGAHFPPSDPQYKGISSRLLLTKTLALVKESGFRVINLDSTVILQKPHLQPHIPAIRQQLQKDLDIPLGSISVKAKTKEGLDAVGRQEAIETQAVVLLESL